MVVGAAEGLGAAFAKNLAARGFNLILIDKLGNPLTNLAESLSATYGITCDCITQDLSLPKSDEVLFDAWKTHRCRLLVYNAAYGPVKPFLDNSDSELALYWQVNVQTTVSLVHKILAAGSTDPTGILLLSSMAGFRGTQFVIPYAGTKAFLWNFVEGCHYEFKDSPFTFGICCPGATATPNYLSTEPKKTSFSPKPRDPDKVAKEALKYFGRKIFIIPGWDNKMVHFLFTRLLPRRWATSLRNSTMKQMYS